MTKYLTSIIIAVVISIAATQFLAMKQPMKFETIDTGKIAQSIDTFQQMSTANNEQKKVKINSLYDNLENFLKKNNEEGRIILHKNAILSGYSNDITDSFLIKNGFPTVDLQPISKENSQQSITPILKEMVKSLVKDEFQKYNSTSEDRVIEKALNALIKKNNEQLIP